jgi:hypothetical protein
MPTPTKTTDGITGEARKPAAIATGGKRPKPEGLIGQVLDTIQHVFDRVFDRGESAGRKNR